MDRADWSSIYCHRTYRPDRCRVNRDRANWLDGGSIYCHGSDGLDGTDRSRINCDRSDRLDRADWSSINCDRTYR